MAVSAYRDVIVRYVLNFVLNNDLPRSPSPINQSNKNNTV